MRTKIRFDRNSQTGEVIVMESMEVDPGVIMDMQEEVYDLTQMTEAYKQGIQAFQSVLRRRGFFPTHEIVSLLFEETRSFFEDESQKSMEVEYSDVENLPEEDFLLDDTDVELDDLLDEDGDTKEDEIKEIDSEDDTPRFTPEDTSEHEN